MSENTKIAWAHDTFNPWWGCTKVSAGCENCYAEAWAKRTGHNVWGPKADRRELSQTHWRGPLRWNASAKKSGKPRRVFCGSMCDVCEDRPDLIQPRARLMNLIEDTPALTWMLLTKRPENFPSLFARWDSGWPPNAWAGATMEDQPAADKRAPLLLAVPAAVRFVSYEPALGPVDFDPWLWAVCNAATKEQHEAECMGGMACEEVGIDWLICGGESGHGARPFSLDWARSVRDQCKAAGISYFYKQGGASSACKHDKKGGCQDCMPADLRVREFPR